MSEVDQFLQTFLSAPADRKKAALAVLRGEAVTLDPVEQSRLSEPYLTQCETARRIGVSVSTLWRWNVPSHFCGGWRRYRLSEVQAYLRTEEFKRRTSALRAERQLSAKGTTKELKPNHNTNTKGP